MWGVKANTKDRRRFRSLKYRLSEPGQAPSFKILLRHGRICLGYDTAVFVQVMIVLDHHNG